MARNNRAGQTQIPAVNATPAPPVGTALVPQGVQQHGIFCKAFTPKTSAKDRWPDIRLITIFSAPPFTFITKTPPAAGADQKRAVTCEGIGRSRKIIRRSAITHKHIEEIANHDARPECFTLRSGLKWRRRHSFRSRASHVFLI